MSEAVLDTGAARRGELLLFLREWLTHPLRTASAVPSSDKMARVMAAALGPLPDAPEVELGPGTGPVTRALLARGLAEHNLVMVEFNPGFCRRLRERYPQAHVIEGDARAAPALVAALGLGPLGGVVSSLPLVQWRPGDRVRLVRGLLRDGLPGARFVQFSYAPNSPVPDGRAGVVSSTRRHVWANIPPAGVWSYALGCSS